jgi:hypothetical protein
MSATSAAVAKAGRFGLQVVLIATSAMAIFHSASRSARLHGLVGFLFAMEASARFYSDWKAGLLTSTPKQLYDRFRTTGPIRRSPLASIALFMGFVAVIIVKW